MLCHSPCELYIKYLVLSGYDNATIKASLTNLRLDFLEDSYVNWLRQVLEVDKPERFCPQSRTDVDSMRYTARHGVLELFQPTRDVITAFEILDEVRAKEFIESTLVGGAPVHSIAEELRQHYFLPQVTTEAVQKYHQFFWNMRLLDATDVRTLLYCRATDDAENGSGYRAFQGKARKRAMYKDPRWIAASLPRSPLSMMIAQANAGVMPSKMDEQVILECLTRVLLMRALETTLNAGPDWDRVTMNSTVSLRNLHEIKQGTIKPEEAMRSRLEQIILGVDQGVLPLAHVVSGGHHTAEIAALPEPKDPTNERK